MPKLLRQLDPIAHPRHVYVGNQQARCVSALRKHQARLITVLCAANVEASLDEPFGHDFPDHWLIFGQQNAHSGPLTEFEQPKPTEGLGVSVFRLHKALSRGIVNHHGKTNVMPPDPSEISTGHTRPATPAEALGLLQDALTVMLSSVEKMKKRPLDQTDLQVVSRIGHSISLIELAAGCLTEMLERGDAA